jgi:hypothetical protein
LTFTIAGNYNLTATYSGDTNFAASSTVTAVQQVVGPTAANVSLAGRVTDGQGRGVGNARVSMQSQSGQVAWAMTNPFGFYRFVEVTAGQTYLVSVTHKRYSFASRTISLSDEILNVDFVPISEPAAAPPESSSKPGDSSP